MISLKEPFWEKIWERISREGYPRPKPIVQFVDFYNKNYKDKEASFLDIGCGHGGNTHFIVEMGNKVVAVDISTRAINKLRSILTENKHKNVEAIVANIFELDFQAETFDCIIDNCSLQAYPLELVIEFIKKSKKWLKPDGRWYVKTAAEPYSMTFDMGAPVRISTQEDIGKMFEGFTGRVEPHLSCAIGPNGREFCNYFVGDLQVSGNNN